jgi:ankyrin repeat protein
MIIPFPMEKVILALLPSYEVEIWDPNVSKIEDIEHISNEELSKTYKMKKKRSSTVIEANIVLPFPLTGYRKNKLVATADYDPEKKILYQIFKPCLQAKDKNLKHFKKMPGHFYEKIDKKVENIKYMTIFVYYANIYQKLDENRTLFTQIIFSDLGIPQNKFLFKMITTNRGSEMRKIFIKHICSKPSNYFHEIKEKYNNDPFIKQILELEIEKQEEEYEKMFQKKSDDKKEYFQIETQKIQIMDMGNYLDEKGDFKIELVDFKNISSEEYEMILYNICLLNDVNSFQEILKDEKFDVNMKFKSFEDISLIHLCSKSNSIDIFKKLLEMGKDIDEEDSLLRRPIHIVSLMGYRDFLLYLIKMGCDVNSKDVYGFCPIHFSIINYNNEIIQDLLLFGSDINMKKNDSTTILHDLVKCGNYESLKYLINSDFKLKYNPKDAVGNTPLHYAVIYSKMEFIKLLLVQSDVKIDTENENGMNLLHLACHYGNDKILSYLLTLKDITDIIYNQSKIGYTAMHYAVNSSSTLCILKLIDFDIKLLNIQDNNGDTPLHIAIKKNNIQIIFYLSTITDLSLSNKKNDVLKNLIKNIDIKSFIENNF